MSTNNDYTIHVTAKANEVLDNMHRKLDTMASTTHEAASYEELAEKRRLVVEAQQSFIRSLLGVIRSNDHDGNVRLAWDGDASLFFSYDSGYHGAMIFHNNHRDGEPFGTWSVHT